MTGVQTCALPIYANGKAVLESGAVYSLGVGGSDGKRHAMLSAMVLVGDRETQVLWSAV